jgi:hypothetical protein
MSQKLRLARSCPRVEATVNGPDNVVNIGEYGIPMEDFVALVHHVMTGTDLHRNDPRERLLRSMCAMTKVRGEHMVTKRFRSAITPVQE